MDILHQHLELVFGRIVDDQLAIPVINESAEWIFHLAQDRIAVREIGVAVVHHLDKEKLDEENDPDNHDHDLEYFLSTLVHLRRSKLKYCKNSITAIVKDILAITFSMVNQNIPNPPASVKNKT